MTESSFSGSESKFTTTTKRRARQRRRTKKPKEVQVTTTIEYRQGDPPPAPWNHVATCVNLDENKLYPLPVTLTVDQPWLSASPLNGTTPLTVLLTVDPSTLEPGDYKSIVTFLSTGPEIENQPAQVVVELIVTPSPAPEPEPGEALTIFGDAAPTDFSNEARPIELGVKFRADVDGYIAGIRFYKAPEDSGPHTATLWSIDGDVLSSTDVEDPTGSRTGWQTMMLDTPVAIVANTTYVGSYHSTGKFAYTYNAFIDAGVDNAPLHALQQNEANGGNGVFSYSDTGEQFPTSSYNAANYWVDVLFTVEEVPPEPEPEPPAVAIDQVDLFLSAENTLTDVMITRRETDNEEPAEIIVNASTIVRVNGVERV